MDMIEIRDTAPDDEPSVLALYPKAFPDEDLVPLVAALMRTGPEVLSLNAWSAGALAGNVIFTPCAVTGSGRTVGLLGPLAVAPDCQRKGTGSALVREGLRRLSEAGFSQVFVLGDPAYYGRFGFAPETGVRPPYTLPAEWDGAWQSLGLSDGLQEVSGALSVPGPWRQPSLWGA